MISDNRYRTVVFATISLTINVSYAIYNFYIGMITESAWFITMCFYYTLLGFMRFFAVISEKKNKATDDTQRLTKENRLMKHTGIILLFMTLALSGTVVLTIQQNQVKAYGTIPMITIAAYTFYKVVLAVIHYVSVKKHCSPLLSTIRNIGIADAAMSILPMQSSMIASFDNGGGMSLQRMTILTGSILCGIILYLAISMIINSRRNLKWQDQSL